MSTQMTAVINSEKIRSQLSSKQFVCIKIKSDTEGYTQFAQIYKLVPLPSLFFIGLNGSPLVIFTHGTEDELNEKIKSALSIHGYKSPDTGGSNSAAFLENESQASSSSTLAKPSTSSTLIISICLNNINITKKMFLFCFR